MEEKATIGSKPYAELKYRGVKGRRIDLGDRVVLVLDDWGAVLGIDWARHNGQRVQGVVHMETVAAPLNWSDLPEQAHPLFKALRSPEGERLVLRNGDLISFSVSTLGKHYRTLQNLDKLVDNSQSFWLLFPNRGYFELTLAFFQKVIINRARPVAQPELQTQKDSAAGCYHAPHTLE